MLVVHLARGAGPGPARVGLIVSRRVGSAVVRNRVKRRLRHLVGSRLRDLPDGSLVVIRANPPAATASWEELGAALDAGLRATLGAPATLGRAAGAPRPGSTP